MCGQAFDGEVLCPQDEFYILDGAELPALTAGASDLLLAKLYAAAALPEKRPLFLYNFVERLDEAVELGPVFETLCATGRQVFVAVPHYYDATKLEDMPYVTIIPTN